MPIFTVLGPIEPEQLGRTSMHEHLLVDTSVWLMESHEQPPKDRRVTIENLGWVRWNLVSLEDNLHIDDPEVVSRELAYVRDLGGSGIVDLTCVGLGRRVNELKEISRRAGLHIMVGCGFYVQASHPVWVDPASVDQLTEFLVTELRDGIDDTGIRPALIGEVGTSHPVSPQEQRVVRAAGRAATQTGAAVNIHLSKHGQHGLEVLDMLTTEGLAPERIMFSHMDYQKDINLHKALGQAGAVLGYDSFGSEFYYGTAGSKDPTDVERFQLVRFALDEGFGRQIALGCDVWVKACLKAYGGMGYEHLLKRVVPALSQEYAVDDSQLEEMLINTPRRLLTRPSLTSIATAEEVSVDKNRPQSRLL